MSLITTVIPTYRRPLLLKRAIQSVLNQTMADLQVSVWDNASGDETARVVQEMAQADPRLKYYCHAQQIEAAENFQKGISAVTTPFFSVLADDDLLAPDFYETALAALDKSPRAMFFLGSTLDVKSNGKVVSANASFWDDTKIYEPSEGLNQAIQHYFNWTGAVFRTEVRDPVHLDPQVKPIDLDFVLRLSAQFPFVLSKRPCALFIHHKQSYSTKNGLKLVWPSWRKMIQNLESIQSLSEDQKREARKLMLEALAQKFFSISVALIAAREFKQAREVLTVCLGEFPQHKGAKALSAILRYAESNRAAYWFFRTMLGLYRFEKRMSIQRKYGKFSAKLMGRFR